MKFNNCYLRGWANRLTGFLEGSGTETVSVQTDLFYIP